MNDAYEVCRFVRRYRSKNGYAPRAAELPCDAEFVQQLVTNGVVDVLPLHDDGPPVGIVLTDKGLRMSERR